MERMVGMFSKELAELDRNTVRYMMDEMQEEIDQQKEEIGQQKEEIDQQKERIRQLELALKEAQKR